MSHPSDTQAPGQDLQRITAEAKARIRETIKNVERLMPGFRRRNGQNRMVAEVARAMSWATNGDEIEPSPERFSMINAPTGNGKTLGYVVPGVISAQERDKTLVVCTATVTLQEQLMQKDLPILAQAVPGGFTYAIAKGRARYVCPLRLEKVAAEAAQGALFPDRRHDELVESGWAEALGNLAKSFETDAWDGDKDAWPESIEDGLWTKISTDSHGCLGRDCARLTECPYYLAKSKLREVDLIVANHDLVLSDLASGGSVLPPPPESLYVIDEAHDFPQRAVKAFAASHTLDGAGRWLLQLQGHLEKRQEGLGSEDLERLLKIALDGIGVLKAHLHRLNQSLNDAESLFVEDETRLPVLRYVNGLLPEPMTELAKDLEESAAQLCTAIGTLKEAMLVDAGKDLVAQRWVTDLGVYGGRIETIAKVWDLMRSEGTEGAPNAKWIRVVRAGKHFDFEVCASPLSVAGLLHNELWSQAQSAVLTSATLTTLGQFRPALKQTGLIRCGAVPTLSLDFAFDYERNGRLVIPQMRSKAKDSEAHTKEIIECMPDLVDWEGKAGTLVLFSSRRQLEAVFEGLPTHCKEKVLRQGSVNRSELLRQHRARIDGGETSVLFGLASLAEGVDLPGAYVTHVIIAKLPFAVPTDPLEEAIRDWIESRGGNHFMRVVVPQASKRLEQAVGRLLRKESDTGRVTVLDQRLTQTRYGQMMLAALPPFRVERNRALAR